MKPNILIILTDQQSASMMSCAGNRDLKTPSMDYLARNGVRFEKAYCTNPVCMPSRFSLFTGKMPSHINLLENEIKDIDYDKVHGLIKAGIGHILKNAGYEAAYAGKQHFPGFTAEDLGFDVLTLDEREECTGICTEYIMKAKEKPYCLVTSLINPHDICYMAIRDFATSDEAKSIIKGGKVELGNVDKMLSELKSYDGDMDIDRCPELPVNHLPQEEEPGAIKNLISKRSFRLGARENYSEADWRRHRYVYHRLTEMVDEKIGSLLQAVKESGQEENTVIIFTSDHGDMDAAHKLEHKTVFYEEAARIPLIVCQKDSTPAGSIDSTHLISNGLDLIPTLLDYVGISESEGLKGRSFRPLAEGKKVTNWREVLPVESEIGKMVITEHYKYARFYTGDKDEQLYDLRNDPFETKNAAFIDGNKQVLQKHRNLFDQYIGTRR